MAISTPVVIGTDGSNTSGTTFLKITVPAGGVPAGALINVAYVSTEGGGARSISDTAGNTYVRDFDEPNHPSADRQFILWRQENALALSSGNTIDISWGSSVTNNLATAWYTEGVDDTATPTTGTPSNNSYASTRFPNSGNTTTTDAEAILFGMVGGGFNSFFHITFSFC